MDEGQSPPVLEGLSGIAIASCGTGIPTPHGAIALIVAHGGACAGHRSCFEECVPQTEVGMRFMPIVFSFLIALVGAAAVGLRPGYPFATLLMGATIVAAMTGLAASVLQFLPQRLFLPTAIAAGCVLGLLVAPMLNWAEVLGFGDARGAASVVWPLAAVVGLLLSRASGLDFPTMRRRRTNIINRS
jgi:hypothetical protein